MTGLADVFAELDDSRAVNARHHSRHDILFIALCTVISAARLVPVWNFSAAPSGICRNCLTSTCILTSVWENPRIRFVPCAADRSQQGHTAREIALVAALGLTEPGRLPGLTKPVSCK